MTITLTERAAKEVQKTMNEHGIEDGAMLRISIRGGGCSGFEYGLNFDVNYDQQNDLKTIQHGVPVVVDKRSALHLDGTTLDFADGIDRRGFKFDNPNAVKTCGCGSSFSA